MSAKKAWLTIDDSPSTTMEGKVDVLSERGIVAVWFCLGENLAARPHSAIHAIKAGQILGNHGYDHRAFSSLTVDQCRDQITETDRLIDAIYRDAGTPRPAKYFRFPYGDKGGLKGTEVLEPYSPEGAARKAAIQRHLAELGYDRPDWSPITYRWFRDAGLADDLDWYWTYDVMDWSIQEKEPLFGIDSIERVYDRMEEDVPEGGRGLHYSGSAEIVLTHDHDGTARYFAPIVDRLSRYVHDYISPLMSP